MTPEAHSFIEELLVTDPMKRLGSNGIQNIKDHCFFSKINWDTLMRDPAPFVPAGRDKDTIYFPNANDKDEDFRHIIED